jgi:hypothetical protein
MTFFTIVYTLQFLAYVNVPELLKYICSSNSTTALLLNCLLPHPVPHADSSVRAFQPYEPTSGYRLADIIIDSCMEILTIIFWLVTWALLASKATSFNDAETYTIGVYTYTGDYLPSKVKTAIDCTKASAGLGALEWVLFIITLAFYGSFTLPS